MNINSKYKNKIPKVNGFCAVLSLWYISGKPEATVRRVCDFYGFIPAIGMLDDEWQGAAKQLSIRFKTIKIKRQKLGKFLQRNPTGLFFIGTVGHLFVLDNGVIIDPINKMLPGLDRTIIQVWKVL